MAYSYTRTGTGTTMRRRIVHRLDDLFSECLVVFFEAYMRAKRS
jgi:hypothetical protein